MVDGTNHLAIGHMLVLQGLGSRVIDVVLFGNPIQPVNAWIPTLQAFLQMRAGSHVLIAGPMPFAPALADPFLDIQSITSLFRLLLFQ